MSEQNRFGRWLKRLRTEHDLTQEMLAELIGCAVPTIRSFEIGRRRPSREMAERIANVLRIAADDRNEFLRLARLPVEVADPDLPADLPVATQVTSTTDMSVARHRLPFTALPHLIGREAEIDALLLLIQADQTPLVTIVGPGGMGKTKLAQQVALKLQAHFAEGIVFVPLASVATGDLLPTTIADSLQISLQQTNDVRQRLVEALADRHLLLVLDNFEHLLGNDQSAIAIDLLRDLIQHATRLRLLVTSRERLRIGQERTFELTGLATPNPSDDTAGAIDQSDAVLLFVERAHQVASGFVLTEENRQGVARICRALNGIPLALEQAAAWTRVLSCDEIADEIQRNIDFLMITNRDMEPRHRSMRAVFDHSWSLLTPAEQQSMAQLSIFADGCRRDAAQAVAGATLPLLATLIDKSLLEKRQSGAGTRYGMHELVRQYSVLHLQQRGEEEATRRRHALYYLCLVEQAQPHLRTAQQVEWLARLGEEHDNLRAALAWSLQQGEVELAARLVWAFHLFWWIRNYINEGRRWSEAVLAHKEQLPLPLQIRVTMAAEAMVSAQADAAAIERYAIDLRELSRQAGGDRHADAYAATSFGFAASLRGDLVKGLQDIDAARLLFHEVGDMGMASQTETWTGASYLRLRDYARALPHFEAGLAYAGRAGDRLGITAARYYLGQMALLRHQVAVAQEHFRAAIPPAQEMGDRANIAYMLEGLAVAAGGEGNYAHAAQLFGAAQSLFERIGLPSGSYYQPDQEHYTAIRRQTEEALGDERFQQLQAAGRAMALTAMIALAAG